MAITKIQSESLNLADTYAFTGTVTGAGETNAPAFEAYVSAQTSYSAGTTTKVQFNTERYDTDNAYDNSTNYRFTVPTGQGGKYFISSSIHVLNNAESGLSYVFTFIYKNGSHFSTSSQDWRGSRAHSCAVYNTELMDLSAGDYIEIYLLASGTGTLTIESTNGNVVGNTKFMGFKISS